MAGKKKILVVDDSLFMRTVLAEALGSEFEITMADCGETAIAQSNREEPDLVLLDIVMPPGDEEGVNVLAKLMEINPQARVVMMTAVGQDPTIEKCRRLGARDYLIKPFDPMQIRGKVNGYLAD